MKNIIKYTLFILSLLFMFIVCGCTEFTPNTDKFNVIYNFNVVSYSPMKSLFDTYEFEDKGQRVTEDVNGVKMN